MNIEYGSIKYFTLLRLQEQLNSRSFGQLPLKNYGKLKTEVDMAIETINHTEKHKNDCSDCDGTGIIDNSYMTCLSCNGSGKRTLTTANSGK